MFAILHVPGDKVLYMQNSPLTSYQWPLLTLNKVNLVALELVSKYCRFSYLERINQQLARLSPLVTLPASNTCPSNNNACGWSSAVALKIVKIVYCRSKNKYFSYLYWHLKLLLCLEWLQIHVKRERESVLA